MLTLTARTKGDPLVMANLLTTTTKGDPEVSTEAGDGFISGVASGKKFAFSTKPGITYKLEYMETDALALTWSGEEVFITKATVFRKNGDLVVESDVPATFEVSADQIKYFHPKGGKLIIGAAAEPTSVQLNGNAVENFSYHQTRKVLKIEVPEGEGTIVIE